MRASRLECKGAIHSMMIEWQQNNLPCSFNQAAEEKIEEFKRQAHAYLRAQGYERDEYILEFTATPSRFKYRKALRDHGTPPMPLVSAHFEWTYKKSI